LIADGAVIGATDSSGACFIDKIDKTVRIAAGPGCEDRGETNWHRQGS
jgi:hypothetical protein